MARLSPTVRALAALLVAAIIFMAGFGTSSLVVTGRIKSMMSERMSAVSAMGADHPGANGHGTRAQDPGGASSMEAWAEQQGLPESLPKDALKMLYQQYPSGVPADLMSQIEAEFGPGSGGGDTSGQPDLEAWARDQGLPAGLPPYALETLYQEFPNGIPANIKKQLKAQLGG